MRNYALRRMAAVPLTLLGVSIVTFAILQLVPGGPEDAILGAAVSNPAAVAAVKKEFGLDKPLPEQYAIWLSHALTGNFGTSTQFRVPVSDIIGPKLEHTLILTAGSLFFAVVIGITLGILAAVYHNSYFDRASMFLMLVGASAPVFWIGILLSYVFAIQLNWLPALGMSGSTEVETPAVVLRHLLLPALTNSIISMAVIARIVRSTMLEILTQPYILAARARGFSKARQVVVHGFRNVLSDTINITGLQVGFLFGGALFTEVVFVWPGIGSLIYGAIQARDYVVLQASVLIVSAVFVVVNLISDLARVALDPRATA